MHWHNQPRGGTGRPHKRRRCSDVTRAEAFQIRFLRERRLQGLLWTSIAVAAYILAYSLATTNAGTDFGDWPRSWELPIQEPIDEFFEWTGDAFAWFFNPISDFIDAGLAGIDTFLLWLPWPVVVAAASMLGLRLGGRWLGLFCGAAALFIGLNGFWDSAMLTLSVVGVSVIIAVGLGVPVGVFAAFSSRFESVVRPILDTMQVLPAFVYLIPALVLFGVSGTQGIFLTVVYSIPPVIRLTNLGIRQVPQAAVETAHSHGSTTSQTLFQVQLPLAKSSIMVGINQTIMMAVSMVIITALVGVEGLGRDVWLSLREVDAGEGLESGIAIVLLAIILDRFSYALVKSGPNSSESVLAVSQRADETAAQKIQNMAARYTLPIAGVGLIAILLVLGSLFGSLRDFPDELTFSMADPVNRVFDWMAVNLYFITSWVRDTLFRELGYSPIHTLLLWLPWPALMIVAAGLACFIAGRRAALLALVGLAFAGIGGVWDATMDTLSQVLTAGVFTVVVGVALGILAAQSRAFESVLRPILDTMQTMPIFVYLIPVIMLWGVGPLVGIIATSVYALPPVIRMTSLGIKEVPAQVIETALSHGSTAFRPCSKSRYPWPSQRL
ncbi:Glycine betaine transport system permease protein OpuAB [Geodia barretti]|uniref:Glycine betaine transport system permease protein OpuAB n=2 Tax=Geodia barretti TaxID=519541 RepID=A0AA35RGZ9_GEOBA|nr:Glycine betaine transport system permease protein OpuAB [Geodia barretti]